MTTYLLKSLHWNPDGYIRPAGFRATGGYPSDTGFGHEEWNGSSRMRFQREGIWYRAFYTNSVNDSARDSAGDTTLFMYASHEGVQDLVGVAGRATDVSGADGAALRAEVRRATGLADFWKDAWSVALVRARFDNDEEQFRRHWEGTMDAEPPWICPESHFLWLKDGAQIDASQINEKTKLNTRFTAFAVATSKQARVLMDLVPAIARTQAWLNIQADIARAPDAVLADIEKISADKRISATTRAKLIDARLGQGQFRSALLRAWHGQCAVTGCRVPEALRASHIKPWRESTNAERLDPDNGLLLVANVDALFDRGLISFNSEGSMVLAPVLSEKDRVLLGVPRALMRQVNHRQHGFLASHRERFRLEHGF